MTEMYETPEVEIVEANVEKGFANTNTPGVEGTNNPWGYEDEPVF